jgi:hypothetical protein
MKSNFLKVPDNRKIKREMVIGRYAVSIEVDAPDIL